MSVVQGGSHNRSFVYDSLKRLTSSTNPETGTSAILYTYDVNGNVQTKTDGRGIKITYSYDSINRILGRTYSNGDPAVSYVYDQSSCQGAPSCFNIGHRTAMLDAGGSESWAYDRMGRLIAGNRDTNSVNLTTSFSYDLNGDLATIKYPSGRTITYTTDSAGRPSSAQDVPNSVSYVTGTCANGISSTGVCYAPQGEISAANLGTTGTTAVTWALAYNKRLQTSTIQYTNASTALMSLAYNYLDASNHNNGNLVSTTNTLDGTRSQQFSYDQVNRVTIGETISGFATNPQHCWGESYTYDQWSNLTAIGVASSTYNGCTQESLSVVANIANRITSFSYDASGNVLADASNSYTWNAESEMKTGSGVGYTYNGDSDRVETAGRIYWYGLGKILNESDSSGKIDAEYVYFGGRRVAWRDAFGNINFYLTDIVGTSRGLANQGTLCYDADFTPFGGQRVANDTNFCPQSISAYLFMGKERDAETNNDNFGARYYSSQNGRWTSPDWSATPSAVPYANLTNPQTLNLYAMVHDNPVSFADLDGHGTSCDPKHDFCNSHLPGEFLTVEDVACLTNPGLCTAAKLLAAQEHAQQQDASDQAQMDRDKDAWQKAVKEREKQIVDSQTGPAPGSPEYVQATLGEAGKKASQELTTLAPLVGGPPLAVAVVIVAAPVVAAGGEAAGPVIDELVVRVAANPKPATDFFRGFTAGSKPPPPTIAGVAGYVAAKVLKNYLNP